MVGLQNCISRIIKYNDDCAGMYLARYLAQSVSPNTKNENVKTSYKEIC